MHTAFAEFVRDAEASIHDPDAIAERLRSLLAEDGWLAPEHQAPGTDSYRQHLLHVSSAGGLSVVALVWRPGQATPIHDHVSWCVVGVYRGLERETRYRLVGAELERTGTIEARTRPRRGAQSRPPRTSTPVEAGGDGLTISIHVYGADIERLGSSVYRRFDDLALASLSA